MTALTVIFLAITTAMTCGMSGWLYREHRSRRASEQDAALDRAEIRLLAETTASDVASCVAVIDRLGAMPTTTMLPPRRRLYAIRDDKTGISQWQWE